MYVQRLKSARHFAQDTAWIRDARARYGTDGEPLIKAKLGGELI